MRMSSNIFFVIEYYSIEYHPQRCDDIVIALRSGGQVIDLLF
jgi:hypothetical protein